MRILDYEKYKRIMEEVDDALFGYGFDIGYAVEEYDNFDDVIEYILDEYDYDVSGNYMFAIPWLKENITTVNYYMIGDELKGCTSIHELARKARCLEAKDSLLKMKDKIQELIDLVLRTEDEDDDEEDDDEY